MMERPKPERPTVTESRLTCPTPAAIFTESSPSLGGQELQLLQQMHQLNHRGWHTRLIARPDSRIAQVAGSQKLTVTTAPLRNALDLISIKRLRQYIKEDNAISVISHSNHDANISALAVRTFSKPMRPRLIRMRTYLPGTAKAYAYNQLFDISFTPSQYLRQELLKNPKIRPEKVQVMYPGIDFTQLDTPTVAPDALLRWLATHPGPVIGHGSMLRAEKGHRTLLNALPQVLLKHPDARYVIAGEGYEKVALQNLVEDLKLSEHVYFAGLINPISQLLSITDVAVMPSTYEPLGMFQIEALAKGIPTIASPVGGIPETVKHRETGLLADAGQPDAWAAALSEVLDDLPGFKNMAMEGSKHLRQQFALERNTLQLIAALTHGDH